MKEKGGLVISLDFELNWGIHDVFTKGEYDENIRGVREVIPRLLKLFKRYEIHATWATVGFLYAKNKQELLAALPKEYPIYHRTELSPYPTIQTIGENEETDCYHYGASLIKQIEQTPYQEIGTHTFSHYYCLEPGQTVRQFQADIESAMTIAKQHGHHIQSIVFPRNQVNEDYLRICKKAKIRTYRGNEPHWMYTPRKFNKGLHLNRLLKCGDSYLNLSGHHVYKLQNLQMEPLVNIPSSAFLRPYHPNLQWLEPLRFKRILNSMRKAAKEKAIYHLWWHPHNMGKNTDQNFEMLERILEEYAKLKQSEQFTSYSMGEVADLVEEMNASTSCVSRQQFVLEGNV
ncbi:polysaccharide deacetylase family protein [Viridibacillus arvi]|uniref:polysaccharide deacetylase family protein n=1 Tax=Viridibacillus arvi TaxID=263475 RepID=UPI003CFD6C0F